MLNATAEGINGLSEELIRTPVFHAEEWVSLSFWLLQTCQECIPSCACSRGYMCFVWGKFGGKSAYFPFSFNCQWKLIVNYTLIIDTISI